MAEGFDDLGAGQAKAMLTSLDVMMPGMVMFDFNPTKISMVRRVDLKTKGLAGPKTAKPRGATGSQFKKSEASTITIGDITFTGMDTKPRCDTLLGWASPGGSQVGASLGGAANVARRAGKNTKGAARARASKNVKKLGLIDQNLATRLPMLAFSWGPPTAAFLYTVMLQSVTINYTRFTNLGIPIRAKVSLDLKEQPNFIDSYPTNPTSGGPAGRSGHMLVAGENLQQIAQERYGHPSNWRELADINGIDDPLRVRPGRVIYLPHAGEYREGKK